MKKTVIAASFAALLCGTAQADTLLGLYIGGQAWSNQADGMFGESSDNQATFNFGDETQGSYFIALEHPLPFIPNVKIASTTLDTTGNTTIDGKFEFNGIIFENAVVDTTFDVSYIDYTLYYELFDNDLLTFDFGLTARDLDADIKLVEQVSSSSLTSQSSVSGIIPMLYVSTIVGLPFTGFNVFAEANFLSFDSQTIYDYQVGVSYELLDNIAVDLNLTAGYRSVKLELNDLDDLYSDLSFDGFFAGAVMHF